MIINKDWHSLCAKRLENVGADVDPGYLLSSHESLLWEYEESDFKQFIRLAKKYKSYEACHLIEESFERWRAGEGEEDPLLFRGADLIMSIMMKRKHAHTCNSIRADFLESVVGCREFFQITNMLKSIHDYAENKRKLALSLDVARKLIIEYLPGKPG